MKVIDILNNTDKAVFSFELVPPLKGGDINKIYEAIEPLIALAPPFINITFHRDEVVYREYPDGTIKKVTVTKRPGSVALAAAIMRRYNVDMVPHIVCGGATRHKIENELIDLNFLDIENVMALRGDPIPGERFFTPEEGGHQYSCELVEQITRMNHGQYLDDTLTDAVPTNFCIGVAGYPEKHYEAPNQACDIENLKKKVDAGANYIVTQMFFDNEKFFSFVDRCRAAGITVPIVPGLKPISKASQLTLLPRVFHVDIPDMLVREIVKCKDDSQVKQVGIDWCTAQSLELKAKGVPSIHYYSLMAVDSVYQVAKLVY